MHPTLTSIRRYPVKAMGGEPLERAGIDERGLAGDRAYAVVDGDGRFACGKDTRRFRRRDAVFDFAASTTGSGGVDVRRGDETWAVGSQELDVVLSEAMGAPVRVLPEADVPYFDAGPVSLVGTASLAWCEDRLDVDADARRLRANLVVETDTPFVEETWVGRALGVGAARMRVVRRIERCRTINLAQDGVEGTTRWLKPLAERREMQLGTYLEILHPGVVGVGDPVLLE